jgi:hypothetical protein
MPSNKMMVWPIGRKEQILPLFTQPAGVSTEELPGKNTKNP